MQRITSAVEDMAQRENWDLDMILRVNLVLEEIGLNIMEHSFGEGVNEFEIAVISDADRVIIQITDSGRPFDPLTEAPEPDLDSPIESRPVGGLGIHLVRSMMDQSVYRRSDGKNQLTLVKRRTESSSKAE